MERNKGFTTIEGLVVGAIVTVIGAIGCGVYLGSKAILKYLNSSDVQVERTNVIGDERAENFITFEGERFYSEIDGEPVREYLNR